MPNFLTLKKYSLVEDIMELKKLELQGFRGFKNKQVIKFPNDLQPLVFVGVNGSGKTALLEAIKSGLGVFHYGLTEEQLEPPYNPYNIHVEKEQSDIKLTWTYPFGDDVLYESWVTTFDETRRPTFTRGGTAENLANDLRNDISFYKKSSLSVMAYYPSERLVLESNLDIEDVSDYPQTQLSALRHSLTSFIDFKAFFQWFRRTEDIENEKRLTEDQTYTEPQLEAVRKAVLSMLDGFTSIRIQRSPFTDMVVMKGKQKLSVNQLSSGEKAVLTLAGDLAMRLAIANPGLKNPLEGRGVVLIDEVDLHLHPTWQTKVVSRLQKTFSKIQFVLTTHSPLIINRMHLNQLYFLKDNECFPATQSDLVTYGADILKVLAWQGVDAFLPQNISQSINQIDDLIKSNKLDDAKKKLADLKKEIDPLHTDILNLENELVIKELGI